MNTCRYILGRVTCSFIQKEDIFPHMRTRGVGKNVSHWITFLLLRSSFFISTELALKDLQVTTFASTALWFLRDLLSSLIKNVKCWRFTAILSHYKHLEKTKGNSDDYRLLRCDAVQSVWTLQTFQKNLIPQTWHYINPCLDIWTNWIGKQAS
jgi:hypothetical protein